MYCLIWYLLVRIRTAKCFRNSKTISTWSIVREFTMFDEPLLQRRPSNKSTLIRLSRRTLESLLQGWTCLFLVYFCVVIVVGLRFKWHALYYSHFAAVSPHLLKCRVLTTILLLLFQCGTNSLLYEENFVAKRDEWGSCCRFRKLFSKMQTCCF